MEYPVPSSGVRPLPEQVIRKLISRVFSGKKPQANRHEPAVIPVSNHGITRDRISSGSRRVCETLQSHGNSLS